jgi:hypothetical protein
MHGCSSLEINLLAVLEPNITSDSTFGFAVSTSGDTIVVGDSSDDNSGIDSGAADVFVRDEPHGLNKPISKPVIPDRVITLATQ